jgi:transposase InsO family protein
MMDWRRLLAYVGGGVEEEILARNEYLVAENRVLRARLQGRLRLNDGERRTLAELGKRLGRKALRDVATIVSPETILRWHRRLVAQKWDGSRERRSLGRPRVREEVESLVVRLARENRTWGYKRIAGALANVGHTLSAQTVANILKRVGLPPGPTRRRETTWKQFLRTQRAVIKATDFFTAEVWTPVGLVTYYVLFFIDLGTRRVELGGVTRFTCPGWLKQVLRNVTMIDSGFLQGCRYLLHDRDPRFDEREMRPVLEAVGIKPLKLPAHSPNLNAEAERFIRSVRQECLSRVVLLGEASLRRALSEYLRHYNHERNHQGRGNRILAPRPEDRVGEVSGRISRRERLGGLLNFYWRRAG